MAKMSTPHGDAAMTFEKKIVAARGEQGLEAESEREIDAEN